VVDGILQVASGLVLVLKQWIEDCMPKMSGILARRSACKGDLILRLHAFEEMTDSDSKKLDKSTVVSGSFPLREILQLQRARNNLNPIPFQQFQQGSHTRHRQHHTHPSGSKMNAIFFILPSVRRFLKGTLSFSRRAHASWMLSTVMAMCPKPLPGSELPFA
jgi:hypothetical protein